MRDLISRTFLQKFRECKPLAAKCKGFMNDEYRKNSCNLSYHDLGEILHRSNKTEWLVRNLKQSPGINVTVWLEGCDVTVNATVLEIWNISKSLKNKSCEIHKLCHLLPNVTGEYMRYYMPNRSVTVGGCNVTLNATVFQICYTSKIEKESKSCDISELCHQLRNKTGQYGSHVMYNRTISVGQCNVAINATVLQVCNISMPELNNISCGIHKLCHLLRDKAEKHHGYLMHKGSVSVGPCNVTINATVLQMCKISMPRMKNISCEIHKLCHQLRNKTEKYHDRLLQNISISVGHCNVTMNVTVLQTCNISMPRMKNVSCEIHKLCHLLHNKTAKHRDYFMQKSIVSVGDCNVTMNASVLHICNISMPGKNESCEIHELCHLLHNKTKKHNTDLMRHGKISVGDCNVTINATVIQICNISMLDKKNRSCEIHKLCHLLRNKTDRDDNYSKPNASIAFDECNVPINAAVMKICNISAPQEEKKSCEIYKLCPQLRNLTANHTKYSLELQPVTIGNCNVKLNITSLKEECNITITESSMFRYKIFFNRFKISDSVEKDVSNIAIRELGVGIKAGIWKYKNGDVWVPLGNVSSRRALVLASNSQLR